MKNSQKKSKIINIKLYQQDWMPGFAAYLVNAKTKSNFLSKQAKPHANITLNVGAMLALVKAKEVSTKELPYIITECLLHEIVHVLEDYCNIEFNEERVEQLVNKYQDYYTKKLNNKNRGK